MPRSRAQKRSNIRYAASPFEGLLCFNFYRGWRAIQDYYSPAFPEHFNSQRLYVIGLCADAPTTMSDIAAMLMIDDAAVSNLLKRMEKDGLVSRSRSVTDGRSFEIRATEHGVATARDVDRRLRELDKALDQQITTNDIYTINNVVRALQDKTE